MQKDWLNKIMEFGNHTALRHKQYGNRKHLGWTIYWIHLLGINLLLSLKKKKNRHFLQHKWFCIHLLPSSISTLRAIWPLFKESVPFFPKMLHYLFYLHCKNSSHLAISERIETTVWHFYRIGEIHHCYVQDNIPLDPSFCEPSLMT